MSPYASELERSFAADKPYVSPQYATISVTPRCNLKCTYCFQTGRNQKLEPTFEQLRHIIKDARSLGVTRLSLSGGEPLLRDDLDELIHFASQLDLVVGVDTNGMLLTLERGKDLLASGLGYLCVSLDALSRKENAKTRVGFTRDPYDILSIMQTLCRDKPSLKAIVLCTISRENYMEVPALIEHVVGQGLSVLLQPVNLTIHRHQDNKRHWVPYEQLHTFKRISGRLAKMKQDGLPIQNSVDFLLGMSDYMAGLSPRLTRCYVGYLHIIVNVDLQLESCPELPAIGDLRRQSLMEVWFSEAMEQLRKQIRIGKCPGCWSSCHTERSLRFTKEQA